MECAPGAGQVEVNDLTGVLGFRKMRAMTRQQRSHSIEFKRQVVQEYIAGETLWSRNWDIFQAYRRLRHIPGPSGIAQIVANRFQAQSRGWLLAAFVASRIAALVGFDALLRAATPALGKLRKLLLQHMPTGFDRGHVLDELTDLSRERVIARRPRALQLSRVVEISLPDRVLT